MDGARIGALVSESGDGRDYDGDGDTDDTVIQIHALTGGDWTNVGQAADVLSIAGSYAAFITPESSQGADLNGDGDRDDRVIQAYDIAKGELVPIGWPAEDFVLNAAGLLAFRVSEAAQAEDLNGDGDLKDAVLFVYDLATRRVLNTEEAAINCSERENTCDPRIPYRVFADTVRFITESRTRAPTWTTTGRWA
jgi:hypothetical protein